MKKTFSQIIATCLMLAMIFTGCSKENSALENQTTSSKLKANPVVTNVVCGWDVTFAIKSNGTLWAVGENAGGELGTGDNTERHTFVQVLTNVKTVATAGQFSLALKNDGTVWATGNNSFGQFGNGTNTGTNSFIQVASGIKAIAVGKLHSMILTTNAVLKTAGYNYYGQLGTGDNIDRNIFTQVLINADRISAGSWNSYAKMGNTSLYATGLNNTYQLGTGDAIDRNSFVKVINNNVADIAASVSGNYSLALLTNGALMAVGYNNYGQLGTGDNNTRTSFVQVISSNVSTVSAGGSHSFVKLSYPVNQLKCTGVNFNGQLGLGDNNSRNVFTVTGNANVLSCGSQHTFYVKSDGSVWATGSNLFGQLGTGDTSDRNTWTKIIF